MSILNSLMYKLFGNSSGTKLLFLLGMLVVIFGFCFWSYQSYSLKRSIKALANDNVEAKKFIPAADEAVLYVFRTYRKEWNESALPVMISGKKRGYLPVRGFLRLVLPPGQCIIRGDSLCEDYLSIFIKRGEIAFVEMEVGYALNLGCTYKYEQKEFNEVNCVEIVQKCRLIQNLN